MNILKSFQLINDNNQVSITNLALLAVTSKVLLGFGSSLDVWLLLLLIIQNQFSNFFQIELAKKTKELADQENTNKLAIQNLAQQMVDEISKIKDRVGAIQTGNSFKGIFKADKQ